MNTMAHLVFNLFTREYPRIFYPWPKFLHQHPLPIAPVIWGAILPDLPMVIFYGVEKLLLGRSEEYIWGTAYFLPHWSNFIDLFNSLPFIVLGFMLSFWQRSRWCWILCCSMVLHVLGDLPLHHDDGHRHFFPLSNWKFESPVSYWDPNHHGAIVSLLEAIAVLITCLYLFQCYSSKWSRGLIALLIGLDSLLLVLLVRQFL